MIITTLTGLSLPRKSVVRLTDRPDMTLDVYRGRKTTIQQQQLSFWVQLSHMVSAYSITGRIVMYIVSNDFLSSKTLSFLIVFILTQAFSLI